MYNHEQLKAIFARIGLTEIYQIAVVGQDHIQTEIVFCTICFEQGYILILQRRGTPLPLIFCKQCKGICSDGGGVQRGVENASGGTDMGSKVFHNR